MLSTNIEWIILILLAVVLLCCCIFTYSVYRCGIYRGRKRRSTLKRIPSTPMDVVASNGKTNGDTTNGVTNGMHLDHIPTPDIPLNIIHTNQQHHVLPAMTAGDSEQMYGNGGDHITNGFNDEQIDVVPMENKLEQHGSSMYDEIQSQDTAGMDDDGVVKQQSTARI